MRKLEAALKKVAHVTSPTSLSPKSLNGGSRHKFASSSENVSTASSPISPDKSKLSPEFKSKLRLRIRRSPSPPQLAVRQKYSPTSPPPHEHFKVIRLPSTHKEREEYLLNEFDHRIKMHIAYQAANFELQNVIGSKKELKTLIFKQRKFEQEWPSTRTKAELSSYSEHISITTVDEPREVGMEELIKEAKEMIKSLQHTISSRQ